MDGLNVPSGLLTAARDRPARRRLLRRLPVLLVVGLPTLVTAMYFALIASPQYVSEAQFVVRGQSQGPSGVLSSILGAAGGGSSSASEDTYAVQDYMMSRDAAHLLQRTENLSAVFDRPDADFLARFPSFLPGHSFEHFFRYYRTHIQAELDTSTGISSLSVRTFSPLDSQRIAQALVVAAEQLINTMNARQRANTIASSLREVQDSETRLRQIGAQLADYRNKQALLDPQKQSVPMLRDISDMQTMLTTTKVQLSQLQSSAPSSPLIPVYERRLATLRAQIAQSQGGITGTKTSLVPKITEFDELAIERELAEKDLAAAAVALQTAKSTADRQQVYLDEIVQPDLPDYATYPHSIVSVIVVFLSFGGLYLMGRLLIAGAREHQVR